MVQSPNARPGEKSNAVEPDFRAFELDILKQGLAEPNGSTVILLGQRGVGKSRIGARLIRHATAQPKHLVLESRVRDGGGDGFEVWGEIVRQAIQWADTSGLSSAVIEPVINDLDPLLLSQDLVNKTQASFDQKLKFFDAVLKLLAAVCLHRRVLLVIHDLDRANGDTLELAQFISDNLFDDPRLHLQQQRPGLLLYCVRQRTENPPQIDEFLAQSREHPNVRHLELKGFDREALRNYLQSEHILNKLLSASQGLPNQIDELLDGLPQNVEALFERRMANLSPQKIEILGSLAIYGRPATAYLIASAAGYELPQTANILRDLRQEKILERHIENGEIRFSFGRISNQEITIRSLPITVLEKHHLGWAKALKRSNDPSNLSKQAHHFLHSNSPELGVDLAIKAADAQAVSGAFEASSSILALALPHSSGKTRNNILTRLSELCALRGQTRAAQKYLSELKSNLPVEEHGPILLKEAQLLNQSGHYETSVAILREIKTKELNSANNVLYEVSLAEAKYQLGALPEAQAAGERGLEAIAAAPDADCIQQNIEIVNLLGKISAAQDKHAYALELFEQTLQIAQEKGIEHSEARALINLGFTQLKQGNLSEAEKLLKQGVETARRGDHLERIAFGSLNLGVLVHQKGLLGEAIEYYAECRSLFRRLGNRTQLARVMYNLALLFRSIGDTERANVHNDEANRLARKCNVEKLVILTSVLAARLRADHGESYDAYQELESLLHELESKQKTIPATVRIEYGRLLLEIGQVEEAFRSLSETSEDFSETVSLSLRTTTQMLLGQCMSQLGMKEAILTLEEAKRESRQLREDLLRSEVELSMGQHFLTLNNLNTALTHFSHAQQIQDQVRRTLPEALSLSFENSPIQRELRKQEKALPPESTDEVTHAVYGSMPAVFRPATPQKDKRPSTNPITTDTEVSLWRERYPQLIGSSPKLFKVFRMLDRISASENTVLVSGESGTGKELVAQAIHSNSSRRDEPFIKLNCAALVESLLLSELFGHERGAFTGAHQRKIGRFEMAAGGTIFLDEIGDISQKTQVALLRVLQEYEFERVGGGKTIKLQARIIFATNRNLTQMVRNGQFREDLYYRLKGLSIEVPSLRDRSEDVALLAEHFLRKHVSTAESPKTLSNDANKALIHYRWPGNVRELENVIRSIALYTDSPVITQVDLDEYQELFEEDPVFDFADSEEQAASTGFVDSVAPNAVHPVEPGQPGPATEPPEPYTAQTDHGGLLSEIFDHGTSLADFKKQIQDRAIIHALQTTEGNITRAAQMLGMKRPRLSQIINSSDRLKEMCQGVSK